MSTLKVNQVKSKLRAMFEEHLRLSDISQNDKERETKVLTRCLAALAIYLDTGCSASEAALAVWDGADDNGVDAAYFDASEARVLFVQSKWISSGAGEPAAADVGTFLKGVKDVLEHDFSDFDRRLHGSLADLSTHVETPGTSVQIMLVSTGASQLAKHGQSRIDQLLSELNGEDPEPLASAQVLGLSEVYSGLAADPSQGSVTVDATLLDWTFVPAPYSAYFGVIDGAQLKGWWKRWGKRVVASNIRHSLGSTDVNDEIRNTATRTPEKFWYFNNGITLVAEEASKAPAAATSRSSGIFTFRGASIVNGAQTVSSLAKVEDDSALGEVRVPIRVVLLKSAPEGFGAQVTRTNNLQNRVELRDFVAQDPEQKRLREEMAIEGVEYQYVRTDEPNTSSSACELIELTTALACASGDPSFAVMVKTGIGRFFGDLKKAPYKAIFNPSLSGARAFNVVLAQREIDKWIESKKKALPKKSGPAWGVLVHGNRLLAAAVFKTCGEEIFLHPIVSFRANLAGLSIPELCEDAYGKMIACASNEFRGRFLAVLVKNPSESKVMFDRAVGKKTRRRET